MVYSLKEREEPAKVYYRYNDYARAAARIFIARFPDKNIQAKYVMDLQKIW